MIQSQSHFCQRTKRWAITTGSDLNWDLCSTLNWVLDKMCLRYQGLLLLAWFSGALHGKNIKFYHLSFWRFKTEAFQHHALLITVSAQSATRQKNRSCAPPNLNHGYFVPELQTYSHESNLTYACNKQFKPAAEGWWATSTCNNAEWIPVPQCIGTCPIMYPVVW